MSSHQRFHALHGATPSCCPSCRCGSVTSDERTLMTPRDRTGEIQLVTVRSWGCDLCPWVAVERLPAVKGVRYA